MKFLKTFYHHMPKLILLVGIALSCFVWQLAVNSKLEEDQLKFEQLAQQIVDSVQERLDIYMDAHYSGVGLFSASDDVTREEWAKYIKAILIRERLPGINGLGYAALVQHKDKDLYEGKQASSFPGFHIKPAGTRPDYMPVTYIEPLSLNETAVGYDMGSEANRRYAMESSRDQGKPYLSAKIVLVQDAQKTPGFLSYVPIYKDGVDPGNIYDRRGNFIGWIYAPFIARDFFEGLLNSELKHLKGQFFLTVYNSHEFDTEQKIYSNGEARKKSPLDMMLSYKFYGQEWTFYIQPTEKFEKLTKDYTSIFVLLIGLILSFSLFSFVQNLSTTRAQAEALAAKTTGELRRSESKLKNILNTAADGIFTVNGDGLIRSFNKAAEKQFGYSASDALNKDVKLLIPEFVDIENSDQARKYDEKNIGELLDTRKEFIGRRKDGREFPLELSVSILEGYYDFAFSGIVRDITERKRAENEIQEQAEKLKRSNKELELSNKELEEFAYVTSHDLQEPLRTISSHLELLLMYFSEEGIVMNEKAQKSIHYIMDGALRMKTLIRDVLNYSKLGKNVMIDQVNIKEVLDDILSDLATVIDEKEVTVNLASNFPVISANRVEIVQLFQNLISNAMKFVKPDVKPIITITAQVLSHGEWQFSIQDNGIGINEIYFEKIFTIFQRLNNVETYQGTGIGLALCKKIVENHGGEIWLESQEGVGTTFHFTLKPR